MLRFLRAASAFLPASARNCMTCFGSVFCGFVLLISDQLDSFAVPDILNECVACAELSFKLLWLKHSVVYLSAKNLLCPPDLRCKLYLNRLAHDEKIDVAGAIGLVLCNGTVDGGRLNSFDRPESPFQCWLHSNRSLKQREERLQVWVSGIDAVIPLPAFYLGSHKTLRFQTGKLPRQICRVNTKDACQLAHILAGRPIREEMGQQVTAQFGSKGEHMVELYYKQGINILHCPRE